MLYQGNVSSKLFYQQVFIADERKKCKCDLTISIQLAVGIAISALQFKNAMSNFCSWFKDRDPVIVELFSRNKNEETRSLNYQWLSVSR